MTEPIYDLLPNVLCVLLVPENTALWWPLDWGDGEAGRWW